MKLNLTKRLLKLIQVLKKLKTHKRCLRALGRAEVML